MASSENTATCTVSATSWKPQGPAGTRCAGDYVQPSPEAARRGTLKAPVIRVKPWKRPCDRDYSPAEHGDGQPVTYARTASQEAAGIMTTGIIWCQGPSPRTVWVSPDDRPRSFAHMALVVIGNDGRLPWAQLSYPSPKSMTTLAA